MKSLASIYAKLQDSVITVRVLIRDGSDDQWTAQPSVRTRRIRQAAVFHNEKMVFRVQLGVWTPVDPSFEFRLSGGKRGDPLRLAWQDSLGTENFVDGVVR